MIDAKHVHKLLECKYDFKHWIKDVISSFNFKDGIDYNTGGWVTNPTRPITMETTDTTVTDLRCVEVADVAEVVLIEEQTQRIQLIRNM